MTDEAEIGEIKQRFGWDLIGDSINNPRNKYFFEADAEKIADALRKEMARADLLQAELDSPDLDVSGIEELEARLKLAEGLAEALERIIYSTNKIRGVTLASIKNIAKDALTRWREGGK